MHADGEHARGKTEQLSLRRFVHPRYWPIWLFWLVLHGTSHLPIPLQHRLGRLVGRLLYATMGRERRAAAKNLEVCFPALALAEREALLRRHFDAVGISFFEMGIGWFTPIDKLQQLIEVHGREHLDAALATGRPLLLWGAHFTTIEVCFTILEKICDRRCSILFRPQRNAMVDTIVLRGRSRFADEHIPRDDVRRMLRRLKAKDAVIYFPDQTYLGNQSALIPFFGEPALTNTATTKLATMTNAIVLTYFYRRREDGKYEVEIGPPIPDLPSDDPVADATRLFAALERFIARAPEQYFWMYRKFKRRPAPFIDPYRATGPDRLA